MRCPYKLRKEVFSNYNFTLTLGIDFLHTTILTPSSFYKNNRKFALCKNRQPTMKRLLPYILLSLFIAVSFCANATHNRAGEITYEQTDDLSFRVTITTYTKTSSVPADRDSLELCWGDGACEYVYRVNGPPGANGVPQGQSLPNNIKFNQYIANHTYPGRFTYFISMTDPNRNGDILNINFPNSDQIPFHLSTKLVILNPQFQGTNNTPTLLQAPIDNGNVGQPFVHNPNAFDIEGDSLSYELIVPLQDTNTVVNLYMYPNQIEPGPDNQIFLDEQTGEFRWDSPQRAGEYNVAFLINEYRSGQLISCMIRDMQITILEEDNRPPEIEVEREYCITAGDTLEFDIIYTDPDSGQLVQLTYTGGPFEEAVSPAIVIGADGYEMPPDTARFFWATTCDHIRDQYYQVVFKAEDNYNFPAGDSINLSTQETVRIKVIAPPPENLTTEGGSGQVELCWNAPYLCETPEDRFRGFSVWRRDCEGGFEPDSCTTGLSGSGFVEIMDSVLVANTDTSFCFTDTSVERGRCYCYRVLADFSEINNAGFPFNFVESMPSDEACVQLSRDLPLITNVSVQSTDFANGTMEIRWSKPNPDDLDTLQNGPPYLYKLYRSEGFDLAAPQLIHTATASAFWQANDTFFIDNNLNTLESPYTYQIGFFVENDDSLGVTEEASSVYLSIAASDQTNTLTWEFDVPWENQEYTIFRKDDMTTQFDSIDVTTEQEYIDEGLENYVEYCYYIRSKGTYGIPGILDPLFNNSQEACSEPIDTIPPCPPILMVTNDCPTAVDSRPAETFQNFLTWNNPNNSCADDVTGYNIFYAPMEGEEFSLIETHTNAEDTTYAHTPGLSIAGCYTVTAIDSVGNESIMSNIECVDNCPIYILPNVFTPNEDGKNDNFVPFPYRFIERIELKIYNRWGGLVFETSDPDINWDGTNLEGKDLAEGVYYYGCEVFEQRLNGTTQRNKGLSGYIHIIR